MQFEFNSKSANQFSPEEFLALGERQVPIQLVRNPRARRYILRLRSDGSARVTIPRGGSNVEARKFVERNTQWLDRALQRLKTRPTRSTEWSVGTEILFRGESVRIEFTDEFLRFGTETVRVKEAPANLRRSIEKHLWKLAAQELPPKVFEFAALHQLTVRRVSVRNQRSRWGSCSPRGTISLNWRIIQAPPFARDYLILHELMHLRQMNHSAKYWREVQMVCPDYKIAERWLKQNSNLLR